MQKLRMIPMLMLALFCADNIAAQQIFTGSGTGAIPDGDPGGGWGTLLAVQFNVSGLTRNIEGVAITLELDHAWAGDVGASLVAPGGVAGIALFERLQSSVGNPAGSGMQFDGQYSFGDGATGDLWQTASQTGTIPPGNYRSSQPGPGSGAGTITSMNAVFAGLTPVEANGTWTLFVGDFWETDTGSVTFAQIAILQEPEPPAQKKESKKDDDGGCVLGSGTSPVLIAVTTTLAALLRRRKTLA